MQTFLEHIIDDLTRKGENLLELTYIVPSRRVGVFLTRYIASRYDQPIIQPEILSIEEFVSRKSGLEIKPDLEIIPHFYKAYKSVEGVQAESFESFLSWAMTVLQDFNEIDRYILPTDRFFTYLGNIKELSDPHWSLEANPTKMVSDYLKFWKRLHLYYQALVDECKKVGVSYQGLAYRQAHELIMNNASNLKDNYVFLGLNALNTAEENIIKELLDTGKAKIYWDTDQYFLSRPYHEAGTFLNKHFNTWKYFERNSPQFIGDNYSKNKQIHITGATGNLTQVQIAIKKLLELPNNELSETAIILADEKLLIPLINALPSEIEHYNITMGLPLETVGYSSFFKQLVTLYTSMTNNGFYYKDVQALCNTLLFKTVLSKSSNTLQNKIHQENLVILNKQIIADVIDEPWSILFEPLNKPTDLVKYALEFITHAKNVLIEQKNKRFELEQLVGIYEVITQIQNLLSDYPEISDYRTVEFLYDKLISSKTLDFIGEPVQGLQIMGLLETRGLDYKNVIMLSVNEGTLPAGKSTNSYIPFDVKKEFELPTYSDKDSVYAYHFYRLLHRVQKASFIFNSDTKSSIGQKEQSRFLVQLINDQENEHQLVTESYEVPNEIHSRELISIDKNDHLINRLKEIAQSGFSPSALTSFVRNPLDFYRQKVLRVDQLEEVEENIEANTMGTIIHSALEELYKPYINQVLKKEHFKLLFKQVDEQLQIAYYKTYNTNQIPTGKNKIIFEVCRKYINKLLQLDLESIEAGSELIIKSLEKDIRAHIDHPELGIIHLRGNVDRIDLYNNQIRIIDYKTGQVKSNQLKIKDANYQDIILDYEYSKAFQVLMYAYLYEKEYGALPDQAGIISFKNFKEKFIKFSDEQVDDKHQITVEILDQFEKQLFLMLSDIMDPNQPIIEKAV
ncbi:PD-(D/E)XK nuclease family protein [Nonlabens sp. SCSIO 43208]|uniref:PD-(D/E)XK nuclease family protein n=1 Tax=Nonlabens sp. SCSIO 43208 TaxID=2793009 RepID=UPI003D6AE52A